MKIVEFYTHDGRVGLPQWKYHKENCVQFIIDAGYAKYDELAGHEIKQVPGIYDESSYNIYRAGRQGATAFPVYARFKGQRKDRIVGIEAATDLQAIATFLDRLPDEDKLRLTRVGIVPPRSTEKPGAET